MDSLKFIWFVLVLSISSKLYGQMPEDLTEDILGQSEITDSEIELNRNLNKMDSIEFLQLGYLTHNEIKAILAHRRSRGAFISSYELLQCRINPEKAKRLMVDTYVQPMAISSVTGRFYYVARFKDSFKSPSFRMSIQHRNRKGITIHFLTDHDRDEKWLGRRWKRPDHITAALHLPIGKWQAVIGDYRLNLGEGLLIGQGFRSGPVANIGMVSKPGRGIRMNTSADEFSFFRGLAASWSNKVLSLTAFGSLKNRDGYFDDELRLIKTGYHRSILEVSRRKNVRCTESGLSAERRVKNTVIRTTFFTGKYLDRPTITGSTITAADFYFSSTFKGIRIYGEGGTNHRRETSYIGGLQYAAGRRFEFGIVHRHLLAPLTPHVTVFGHDRSGKNERGTFIIGQFQHRRYRVSIYRDVNVKIKPQLSDEDLTTADRHVVRIDYRKRRSEQAHFQYMRFKSIGGGTTNTRLHYTNQFNSNNRFQTRLAMTWNSSGIASILYVDFRHNIKRAYVSGRITISAVPDNLLRIYVFENDVPYQYSLAAISNSAGRYSCVAKMPVSKHLSIWIRAMFQQEIEVGQQSQLYLSRQNNWLFHLMLKRSW